MEPDRRIANKRHQLINFRVMPEIVDVARIELATSRLQSERSPAELHARIEKDHAASSCYG